MPSTSSSVSASGSKKMSSTEKKIHHIARNAPGSAVLVNEIGRQLDLGQEEVLQAANSLLKKNLLSIQQTERGTQLVGISMDEARQMGSLGGDEGMIYKHIRDAGNEGIWTKALKARTNLHQTILTRVIKSLENRQMIKAVKSVKTPTRKIYMLYNITPSEELSGGPWYTDHELDVAFINGLSEFCHHFIQQQTWPDGYSVSKQKLYPSSQAARLPTAPRILTEIKEKDVTSTELSVSNIQMLLETLIYDEKIEKVPIPGALVDSLGLDPAMKTDEEDSEEEKEMTREGANRVKKSHKSDIRSSSKQDKKRQNKKGGSRSRDRASSSEPDSDSPSESSSDDDSKRKKRKGSKSHEHSGRLRKKSKKGSSLSTTKSKSVNSSSSSSSSEEKQSDVDSDTRGRHGGKFSHQQSSMSKSSRKAAVGGGQKGGSKGGTSKAKYAGPDFESDEDDDDDEDEEAGVGAGSSSWGAQKWVYRALRPVDVPRGYSETPCARCPVSDFCRPRGPVNAEDCVYYGSWMEGAWSESEDEND